MAESPGPGSMLNFEGAEDGDLFRRFLAWCVPIEWESGVQAEIDAVFARLESADDRAVAVVGSLVVENAVDQLVGAHVPGYKKLAAHQDYSLSMRIELARALRLCPARLLGAADTVRRIRNDFAHRLELARLADCKPEHLASARGHLQQIQLTMVEGKTDREVFRNLVSMVYLSLRGYAFHVERLNQYVREEKTFWNALEKHCLGKYPQRSQDTVS